MQKKRMLLGGAAIAVAMALVGVGVWAAFTDTETSNVAIDTGQLDLVGAEDITVTEMAPGDLAFRDMSLALPDPENDGDLVESIDVATANVVDVVGDPTDDGDVDPDGEPAGESLFSGTDGLQVVFAVCGGGTWTLPAADDPLLGDGGDADTLDDSVACSGTVVEQTEQPLGTFAFTGSLTAVDFGETPTATGTIPDGSTMEVLLQFRLPTTADNAYENASVSFDIVFDAIQRAGVNR
jgi:predicted ribosomally synthesized peptide with SipW-like signal peptide